MEANPDLSDPAQARAYLSSLSPHVLRLGDTSYLHPDFAVKMANAVSQARAAGLPVTVQSGYRTNPTTGSKYDAEGYSLHGYGAAIDVGGIGGAGSPQALRWAKIAQQNGVYNPYGVGDPAEYNHWQMVPWKLENRPDIQKAIVSAGGDAGKIWNAISPVTTSSAASYTPPTPNNGAPPVAQTDWLGQIAGQTPVKTPSSASQPAVKQAAPAPSSVQPSTDWLGQIAGEKAAPPPSATGAPPAAKPAAYDLGNGVSIPVPPAGGYPRLAQDHTTVNPYDPASAQISALARSAAGYAGQQIAGIPSAIKSDFNNSTALAGQGVSQLANGDVLPNFPSSDPSTWGAGGALKTVLGATGAISSPLTGAIHQLVEQPVTDASGNPVLGQEAGMAAGVLAGPQIGKLPTAIGSRVGDVVLGTLDPETARLAQVAREQYGIPVNAPQMTQSPGISVGNSALSRLPFSGAEKAADAQHVAFNGAVARTFGENGVERITPDVMNRARTRIGNDFDTVAQNTNIQVDPQFVSDLHSTINDARLVLTDPEANIIERQAQNIFDKINQNNETISGETYQALTRKGAPLDNLLSSDNPNIANAAQRLRDMLDDGLQRSASPDMQALLTQARRQWASLKTVQPLAAKAPTGDISPALLAGRVNANTGNSLAFGGGGDLGTLARIGQKFLKEPGSSNTAERLSTIATFGKAGQLAANAVGASALGLSAGMTPAEMGLTAAGVPAGLLAGRVVGSGLRSDWLANSLINRTLNPAVARPVPALAAVTGPASFPRGNLNPASQPETRLFDFLGP